MARRPSHPLVLAVTALAVAALTACEPLSRDEVRCEEAIAQLLDCCAGLERSPFACDEAGRADVDCLVGRSCAALREGGACEWAIAGGEGEVCP